MNRPLALAVLSILAASSAAHAEDLLRVYEDAVANDPLVREADANRRANRETRPQALSALLPQFNGTAGYQRSDTDTSGLASQQDVTTGEILVYDTSGETKPKTKTWNLELRQNVFSWANWMALRRSSIEVAQAEADYLVAEQDLAVRVSQRYFDVLAARDTLDAEQSALEAISRQLDQADKRFEVGLIAITDVQEAKSARDNAAAAVIAAKRSLATSEELLREITGRKYDSLRKPGSSIPLKSPEPADEAKWVELSLNQNLALISSRLSADVARANVREAFAGHFPTVDAVGSRSYQDVDSQRTFDPIPPRPTTATGPNSSESYDTTYGFQLNVPLFSGGLTSSRTRQSQYRWIAAKERVVRSSRETERAARDSYLGVISEIARVNALRQALESSQTALRATEAGYEVGTRTAVDVLVARRSLVAAQSDYARSRYDYVLNVVSLRQAAGNLDRSTLAEINAWLDESAPTSSRATSVEQAAQPEPNPPPPPGSDLPTAPQPTPRPPQQ